MTRPVLFTNVSIFDGSGRDLFPGEVRVLGNRIDAVAQGAERGIGDPHQRTGIISALTGKAASL